MEDICPTTTSRNPVIGRTGTPIEAQVKMESIEMQAKSAIEALKPGFLRQTNPFTNFKI